MNKIKQQLTFKEEENKQLIFLYFYWHHDKKFNFKKFETNHQSALIEQN